MELGFITQSVIFLVVAFFVALAFAIQERWTAVKCLVLGALFPFTVPVALFFVAKSWLLNRSRVKDYVKFTDRQKEFNDTYIPSEHVEKNPNASDVTMNPFSTGANHVTEYELNELYEATEEGATEEEVKVNDTSSSRKGANVCEFHLKYPNLPYAKCECEV
jgi:hypothetical protein